MDKLFIKQVYFEKLIAIFDKYCKDAIIWAYGSRVCGDAHDGSDLDLVIKKFGQNDCSLSQLKKYLQESNIPFFVDVIEYDNISESFKKEIEKKYIVIYPCE